MIESQRCSVILCLLSVPLFSCWPARLYVSTTGNDSNLGTFDQPFLTITKAISLLPPMFQPGDTVYVLGGVHVDSATISISKSGTEAARYHLLAYPGERPLLDFSSMSTSSSNRGIRLSGSYWYIRGFDVKGAGDNGMHISGSNNIIEFCAFYENRDTGLQLSNGASNNRIINCDSYYNADPTGENADGFAAKLDVGTGNSFYGCRSWQNCDDGFDGYLSTSDGVTTTLERCWIFKNGYLEDGSPSLPYGDGNGFKMGGGDKGSADSLRHNMILKNCLAFDNRVKGYDQNNNRGSMTLLNCTAYRNGTNYGMNAGVKSGETMMLTNCVALGSAVSIWVGAVQTTDSWMNPPFSPVTDADFVSVDTTGLRGPRKPDGSLPDIAFLHLAPGSQLIDAGTNVGIPYNGAAPDLGAFETGGVTDVAASGPSTIAGFRLFQNYPNPFNPATTISYLIPRDGNVVIRIYDVRGRIVREILNEQQGAGQHVVCWDGRDECLGPAASGVYFVRVAFKGATQTAKIVLLR
jgi:hypothetical protein